MDIHFLKLWVIALLILLVFDFFWLGLFANNFYKKEMAKIGRIENGRFRPIWPAAIAVYVLAAAGLVYFVVPRIGDESIIMRFLPGAFFGLVLFGLYDLTNLSTLKDWTLKITIVDILWGIVNLGVTGTILSFLVKIL